MSEAQEQKYSSQASGRWEMVSEQIKSAMENAVTEKNSHQMLHFIRRHHEEDRKTMKCIPLCD